MMKSDATEGKPQDTFDPLPVGDYRVEIIRTEVRAVKDGDFQYLWLEMQILDGEYANRRIWDRLNLWNANQQAAEIAQRKLRAICRAVGVKSVSDSQELHHRPFIAKARLTQDKRNPGTYQNAFNYKAEGGRVRPAPAEGASTKSTRRSDA